jgi:hypothetical protein
MKKQLAVLIALGALSGLAGGAEPYRVAILDFEDETGMKSDERLGGLIAPDALAQKGVYLVGKQLLQNPAYTLIDRRDFIDGIEQLQPLDNARPTPSKPSFLHAAQALGADVVLRGKLLSFSTGKRIINQGGFKTDFSTLSIRVALEALDAVDGSLVAMEDASGQTQVRQTDAVQTVMSEDDVLRVMEEAITETIPALDRALGARRAAQAQRPKVKLSITTTEDPALVEIDGLLIGSTPVEGFEVYAGDHVLTIGKPGYRDITKRILFEKDTRIEVPMLRVELTAEELKGILDKARLNVFQGIEPALIIETIE